MVEMTAIVVQSPTSVMCQQSMDRCPAFEKIEIISTPRELAPRSQMGQWCLDRQCGFRALPLIFWRWVYNKVRLCLAENCPVAWKHAFKKFARRRIILPLLGALLSWTLIGLLRCMIKSSCDWGLGLSHNIGQGEEGGDKILTE